LILFITCNFIGQACTIVAVSGKATEDGRPLLLKNRDSKKGDVKIKIGKGQRYTYLCQTIVPDSRALSGFNEVGFSILSAYSNNMKSTGASWNSYVMQLALENCTTIEDFENLLDSLPKPMPVKDNYGVMDANGRVFIFEIGSNGYVKYDADESDNGYLIRTNFSFSQDTTGLRMDNPSSFHRYRIASAYLEKAFITNGYITKENLFKLSRCLVDDEGNDLHEIAPYDEYSTTRVKFRYYIPRYSSTSAMVVQGTLPSEDAKLTVAWTMVGPPLTSVTVPYLITSREVLPQKAQMGSDGYSWFSYVGLQLRNSIFTNQSTIDLALLYNQSGTGILQKTCKIEKVVLNKGNKLLKKLRNGKATCREIEIYYSWVDYYIEEQYELAKMICKKQ
jgi:hypothetical protein